MAPASDGRKPQTKEEKEFLKLAEVSVRMPSISNRKAAQKAWDKLPKSSPFKSYKFEGWSG